MSSTRYLVTDTPKIEVYINAIATPTFIQEPVHPNSQGSISGCLYRPDGSIVRISQREGGFHGDYFPSTDPVILPEEFRGEIPTLPGKSIYLGHYMPHFGHFLVETLSTFWTFPSFDSFDNFVFHPFAFGKCKPQYILDAFRAFNLPLHKIVFLEKAVLLEEVTIPERLVHFHKSANTHARIIYRQLLAFYSNDAPLIGPPENRCYYISRVKTSIRNGLRTVANETFVERGLQKLGFSIVYPEELNFPAQIRLFANAEVICGIGGSGLHNALFMRPNAILIEIGDARTTLEFEPMQSICNELAEIDPTFIKFNGHIFNQQKLLCWLNCAPVISDVESALASRKKRAALGACSNNSLSGRSRSLGWWLLAKSILRISIWPLLKLVRGDR